jgi:O-antigen ligase
MNRETIDCWLERAILGLVLGVLVFGTLAFGGVRPSELIVLWWLIVGALGLWIVRLWFAPAFRFLWPPICWSILPFVAYAVWRYRTADIEFVARQELIQLLLCAAFLLVIVNNLYSQESTRAIAFTLIFLAMALSMYGIYQWLTGSNRVWHLYRPEVYFKRASGSYICPNHLAGFLEMIFPLSVAFVMTSRVSPLKRVFIAYASVVILIGIAATRSRAGWLVTGVSMFVLALVLVRNRRHRWTALTILALMMFAGSWLYSRSVESRVANTYLKGHERESRLRIWSAAWRMWQDNPWWGVGPDHFDYRYRAYRDAVDKMQGARPGRAHNDYLNTLADWGLAGFVLALLPLGFAGWGVFKCWSHVERGSSDFGRKQSNRSAFVLGAAAGLLAIAVHSFVDFNMHIPANAFLAVALLAVLSTYLRFATDNYWFTARWPLRIGATLLLGGAIYFLGQQGWNRSREVASLRRADDAPELSKEKISALKSAIAIEPKNPETCYALGEQLRTIAWRGEENSRQLADEAMPWFQRAVQLNRWDVYSRLRIGMCLDWLNRHSEATAYFQKALELDPNNYYTRAMMGWHEFQLEHYREARAWFEKSQQLNWTSNPMPFAYYPIIDALLAEETKIRRP